MLSKNKYDALQTKYDRFQKLNLKAGSRVLDDMFDAIVAVDNESDYERLENELDDCIKYTQDILDGVYEREKSLRQIREKKSAPEKKEPNIKINIVSHIGDNTGVYFQKLPDKEVMDAYYKRQKKGGKL